MTNVDTARGRGLAAVILAVNAVQWVVAEAVTAAAWTDPPYSYATNFISDLGVAGCGTQFQGRTICSPLHTLMNASIIAEGVLFAIAAILLAGAVAGRVARRIVIALALVHGVGFVLVGVFHGAEGGPRAGLAIHVVAAAIGIICANTVAILAGALCGLGLPAAYRWFSVVVGVLGIVSQPLVGVSPDTAGLFERAGVYAWLLWGLATGALLLARPRGLSSPGAPRAAAA